MALMYVRPATGRLGIETKEQKRYHAMYPIIHGVVLIVLSLFAIPTSAQKLSVTNFKLAESDLTASSHATEVFDQNGDRCALIRIQTTQKGFHFDVGSLGISKRDDNHVGEIWIYVPMGVRHLDIRHSQLGSLIGYEFPIKIDKGRTYILELTSEKIFINRYDDSKKQKLSISVTPPNAEFILNGVKVELDSRGFAEQELAFGTYTYRVSSPTHYPKEGQIVINDEHNKQHLTIKDLEPILGYLNLYILPYGAKITIDGVLCGDYSLKTIPICIGQHKITISEDGYQTEERTVFIEKDGTYSLSVSLKKSTSFLITSYPIIGNLSIDRKYIGTTPTRITLENGKHLVKISKLGCRTFSRKIEFNSSNPHIYIPLKPTLNRKNEFYIEANFRSGSFKAIGATIGCYIHNINMEASYFYSWNKSETIYWSGNGIRPIASSYTPSMNISGKIGYGIAMGARFRFTPQIGMNMLKLSETPDVTFANGAYAISPLGSIRFSVSIIEHLAISLSPEYAIPLIKSKGYKILSEISPQIEKWNKDFNLKIGIATFF